MRALELAWVESGLQDRLDKLVFSERQIKIGQFTHTFFFFFLIDWVHLKLLGERKKKNKQIVLPTPIKTNCLHKLYRSIIHTQRLEHRFVIFSTASINY